MRRVFFLFVIVLTILFVPVANADTTFFEDADEAFTIPLATEQPQESQSSQSSQNETQTTGQQTIGQESTMTSDENCQEEWSCTEWGECLSGTQQRTCTNVGTCQGAPPATEQECLSVLSVLIGGGEGVEEGSASPETTTDAPVENEKTNTRLIISFIILLVIALFVAFVLFRVRGSRYQKNERTRVAKKRG